MDFWVICITLIFIMCSVARENDFQFPDTNTSTLLSRTATDVMIASIAGGTIMITSSLEINLL